MQKNSQMLNCRPGKPLPLGATIRPDGANFSVFSRNATSITLVLFQKAGPKPFTEIALDPKVNRTGDIWHILVLGADPSLRYAYRADGPFDPKGKGHAFNKEQILLDPYARALDGGEIWGSEGPSLQRRCCIVADDFDWNGDRPLNVPLKDSIIYELHVRGYTAHESSGVTRRGAYKGLMEKIPYIKSLGVTAVELLPVFEFNELENKRTNPKTGERLKNFWGYSTVAFFAPKASYASNGWDANQVKEFKEMVKAFHSAGLEVIIDVVFNHTAEGDSTGPVISFRGLDNIIYYTLDPESKDYLNLSGCGNIVNCNHPVVQSFILDCLRYWVTEMHVDGFRFDLASILGRDEKGEVLPGLSLVNAIEQDAVLASAKIIAEAWDIGINQVGSFPGRWAEWNSHYRDDIRKFVRGDKAMAPAVATRIAGSSDLYQASGRCPYNSINYITCHDGFTLWDLVSYKQKHNQNNGEENRDGSDHNFSSNSGVEGPTDDRTVNDLRLRRIKTFLTILMVSQGVPMILAGDEFGRTQQGNNNPYCQDNEISWINWNLETKNAGLLRFFRKMIALRNRHPIFRRSNFLTGVDTNHDNQPDLSWHGLEVNKPDWAEDARTLAFMLDGSEIVEGKKDDDFIVIVNADEVEHSFEIPKPQAGTTWFRIVDTSMPSPKDIVDEDKCEPVTATGVYPVLPGAACVFISKKQQDKGDSMNYEYLKFHVKSNIGTITLNRPEKRNALSLELLGELRALLTTISQDKEVRVVIIKGEGKVFSAGHDISQLVDREMAYYKAIFDTCVEVMEKIQQLPQPVIAQVHGVATAAGCQLVAACDLAVAEEGTHFGTPGVKIGLFCTTPGVPLVRAVGRKRALEMLFTGRMISAQEAQQYGLINKAVPVDKLADETRALAQEIAEASPLALSIGKEAFYTQVNLADSPAYDYAKRVIVTNLFAEDAKEGLSAFLEKRQPTWKGK